MLIPFYDIGCHFKRNRISKMSEKSALHELSNIFEFMLQAHNFRLWTIKMGHILMSRLLTIDPVSCYQTNINCCLTTGICTCISLEISRLSSAEVAAFDHLWSETKWMSIQLQ